jgi:glucose-6-phosphate dehydrogenase assembly protein OpcA
MIFDLPDTTVSEVSKALLRVREEGGVVTLGRVLTLVIATNEGEQEEAIEAANDASHEHPMRVIVVCAADQAHPEADTRPPRLDAEVRVGGDAGASEVIVLRAYGAAARDEESLVTGLLLPDVPVVAWWPGPAPEVVSQSALGRLAVRRMTDAAAQPDPPDALVHLSQTYAPGDTDFAWTRLTLWRSQLAAALDQPPYEPVTAIEVAGAADSPSTVLLGAWLRLELQAPVRHDLMLRANALGGIRGVRLTRPSGTISLERDLTDIATLTQPNQPPHELALPRRSLRDCLAEELRRLDADQLYGEVITQGMLEFDAADESAPSRPQ